MPYTTVPVLFRWYRDTYVRQSESQTYQELYEYSYVRKLDSIRK